MMNFLVTYDGSDASRAGFRPSIELARKAGAHIILLRVWRAPAHLWVYPDPKYRDDELRVLDEQWNAELSSLADELSQLGVDIQPVARRLGKRWNVTDEILTVADEFNVDLICMATHGESELHHFFAGSIAFGVLARGSRPVAFFRAG